MWSLPGFAGVLARLLGRQGGLSGLTAHKMDILTHLPCAGLLKMVVAQLGETPRRGKERLYEQILERAARAEGTLLVVFDEAHLLDGDALIDLRLLISSALDVRPRLKMLLVGQEPLRAVLRQARHADLLNRVSVRHQLRPLSRQQTSRYIDFQLSQAGGDPQVFDDSVKTANHDFTGVWGRGAGDGGPLPTQAPCLTTLPRLCSVLSSEARLPISWRGRQTSLAGDRR